MRGVHHPLVPDWPRDPCGLSRGSRCSERQAGTGKGEYEVNGGGGGQRWRGVIAKGKGVSSRGDKNVLKLIMVMRIC